ncbi:helix-turn-helix transcriptional regulator [Gracilibacillus caseinilyticus]|uniref:Helix-turn-helix transcriptional regulator n=1 Tax=Gracilibacillus caseinilyticus TaxID=2932256 RepID=A0ABY4F0V9_9BACI|nr:helix-turn-helix domain-containing protein [Gracilibacillus caseinilyticus]UOQ50304.1 helix-turn-helix transcriptional regulator [Gracilibacillus caseinilyticus]
MCAEEESYDLVWEETKCPISNALDAVGGKWNYKIILSLNRECKRFGELLESLNGISAKTLTCSLKKLEKKNIINKTVYPVVPSHVEYELTKKGKSLHKVLYEMYSWGRQWEEK